MLQQVYGVRNHTILGKVQEKAGVIVTFRFEISSYIKFEFMGKPHVTNEAIVRVAPDGIQVFLKASSLIPLVVFNRGIFSGVVQAIHTYMLMYDLIYSEVFQPMNAIKKLEGYLCSKV